MLLFIQVGTLPESAERPPDLFGFRLAEENAGRFGRSEQGDRDPLCTAVTLERTPVVGIVTANAHERCNRSFFGGTFLS